MPKLNIKDMLYLQQKNKHTKFEIRYRMRFMQNLLDRYITSRVKEGYTTFPIDAEKFRKIYIKDLRPDTQTIDIVQYFKQYVAAKNAENNTNNAYLAIRHAYNAVWVIELKTKSKHPPISA